VSRGPEVKIRRAPSFLFTEPVGGSWEGESVSGAREVRGVDCAESGVGLGGEWGGESVE